MDAAIGNCEWESPHPPHLWGDEIIFPGGTKMKIWTCDGTAEVDE